MAGVHNKDEIFSKEWLNCDIGFGQREVDDGGVDLAIKNSGYQRRCAALMHCDTNLGIAVRHRGQNLRHDPSRSGAEHAEASYTCDLVLEGREIARDVLHLAQNSPCSL